MLQKTDVTITTVAIKTTLLNFNKCSKDTHCMRLVFAYTCHTVIHKWLLMFYVEGEVMYAYVDLDVFMNDVYITQLLLSYRNEM